jgi:hypothetical protein
MWCARIGYGRLLVGIVLSVGLVVKANAQGFNERFDLFSEGRPQVAWSVEVNDQGLAIVFFGGSYYYNDSLFYSSGICSVVVDDSGDFSNGYRLHIPDRATYVGWANSSTARSEGGYLIGGSSFQAPDSQRVFLAWTNEEGIVMNHVELPLPGLEWIGRQAKQTPDGGYVVVGENSQGLVNAFLVKTDPAGTIEWYRTYGLGSTGDYCVSVDLLPDGEGYIMGGQKVLSGQNDEFWVQRVDLAGNVIWSQVWGSPFTDINAHLMVVADGSIAVASAYGVGPGDSVAPYMAKLDPADGSIIWSGMYGPRGGESALFSLTQEPASGDLVAVGNVTLLGRYWGTLLRTSDSGDSLWMRHYQYVDEQVTNGQGILRDVQCTPDGGFIAVGSALSVPGVYTQDVWVIKVDSMGCLEPGCHLITGIESQVTNLQGALTVAPNPLRAGEAVQVSISLPPSITPQEPLRLTVVSSEGRVVQEQLIGEGGRRALQGTQQEAILTALPAGLSAGLYHLHLSDGARWLAGAKVVVE